MAKMITDSQHYSDIADAIRTKSGSEETLTPPEMSTAIENLPSSGGSDNPWIEIKEIDEYGYTKAVEYHNYNSTTGKQMIDRGAYLSNTTLTSITGVDNITTIGQMAFCHVNKLTFVAAACNFTFPNVTAIGPHAFAFRRSASPYSWFRCDISKLVSIGEYAFADDGSTGSGNIIRFNSITGDYELYNFAVLTSLGNSAFENNKTLADEISAPVLTGVGVKSFSGTNIVKFTGGSSLTSVGNMGFADCPLYYFENCPNLATIGTNAFKNTGLLKIWIKDGGTITANSTTASPFYGCGVDLEIWTDAASKPSSWGTYFNNYAAASNAKLTVHYGATYQDYLDA